MSRPQRLGLAGLAVVVLVIAFVALRPAAKDDDSTATTPEVTATESAAAPATRTVPAPPTQTLVPETAPAPAPTATTPAAPAVPTLRAGTVRKLEVDKGDTVRFAVRSATAEEVHVHGYDITKDLEAGKTAQVSFEATIEGIFEIEFEGAGEQIAELRVDP